ncbi:MAG: 50S ribosomal protein L25 [Candidatus Magasanikbacteria bacterium CG_4_10_14_0_2_um_filter_37_12]|uniref:Large ribosomal subunit protein bL25 n=1 Tax=Candidatus Magasanikbacteria bacterium CG_4_10_14_0_2_um_filter_37_12 TaxID=1974637 RepID=A0A2M7V7G9_9BACT|nr:MAG: 50S ribosomal protein L25 [Candidatus Magasanikbacteria bacterium CG_4_10_14_0_2_um_filter_37_12]
MISITAKKREPGNASEDRAASLIPGVLYGPEIKPISVSLDYNTFDKLYNEAGEATLIDFFIEGEKDPTKVLIQDVERDPIKQIFTHIDFRQIKMGEEMTATVPLNFIGEPEAVKILGGTLITSLDTVDVRCLPNDLVSHIDVDLTVLKTFEDFISVSGLKLPAGITVDDSLEALVVKVIPPMTDDQFKALDESQVGDVSTVAVDGEKKDGEETAEGAEAVDEKKKEEKKD